MKPTPYCRVTDLQWVLLGALRETELVSMAGKFTIRRTEPHNSRASPDSASRLYGAKPLVEQDTLWPDGRVTNTSTNLRNATAAACLCQYPRSSTTVESCPGGFVNVVMLWGGGGGVC